ncbi:hypothetical protein MBRA1_003099 [Malassezia brasiliensis]|uniref:Uncharacterized protein n=1 Tax=Malassezia brasiliensis TaxID=1821822 RepID=A0AAF0DW45_9BASI|nr:hypothetical protein MBRA1_003099 [Malassezia brasiliensis]
MGRTPPPWNVSRLARTLARERPAHTYASYQTFLQKNMIDRLNLQQRLRDLRAERGSTLDGVHVPRSARTRATPQPHVPTERAASLRPRVAGGMSVSELHAAFVPRSSPTESLDELEEDEPDAQDERAGAGAGDPSDGTSSEEEPMSEAEMLAFEAQQTHVEEPRTAPTRRRREQFLPEETELLVNHLVELLIVTHWGRDIDDEGAVNVDEELPSPPASFWEEMERDAPRHSARSWMLHFSRNTQRFWRTATDRFLLRLSPSSLFVDAEQSVVKGEAATKEAEEAADEAEAAAAVQASANQDAEPHAAGAAAEATSASEASTASAASATPEAGPSLSPTRPDASASTPHAGPATSTPRRTAHAPHTLDTPSSTDAADVSASLAVYTPETRGEAYTPYSVRVGQRRDHHDAKAHARERHSAPFQDAAPSPLTRRAPSSVPRIQRRTSPSPARARPVRHSLGAPGSPMLVPLWGSGGRPAALAAVEQRRARAAYEARVWALCSEYAMTSPAQLVPFMERAEGDVDACREAVEEYMEALARHYDTERTTVLELLETQLGSFAQVVRVLDVQQRAAERSGSRSREHILR